ncbi:MAG TPA: FixH family protein [Blastocatellia bacterium]|nr:FixH family protein [Blastocatellia bacterium]
MKPRITIGALAITIAALLAVACDNTASSGEKTISSTKTADLTITLASATGQLKSGDNELMLSFADSSGALVDVGAASLKFHMPPMASMAEMNSSAALTTTDTPGKYRARVKIDMGGSWEARISYEGPHGTGQATMSVIAK